VALTEPDDPRRIRLTRICQSLPQVDSRGEQHIAFEVRKRKFAYFLDDHHGDGMVALACKAPPGQSTALVADDPARYFVPAYVGPKGWIGLRLDVGEVDWDQVEALVVDSYRLIAPKGLVRQIGLE
jgi:phosphoribosylglycinamide formyltransferase-1